MPDSTQAAGKKRSSLDAVLDITGSTSDSDDHDAGNLTRNEPAQPPPKRKRGPGKKNSELSTFFQDVR